MEIRVYFKDFSIKLFFLKREGSNCDSIEDNSECPYIYREKWGIFFWKQFRGHVIRCSAKIRERDTSLGLDSESKIDQNKFFNFLVLYLQHNIFKFKVTMKNILRMKAIECIQYSWENLFGHFLFYFLTRTFPNKWR